jgi:hypothetical protein
MEKIIKMAGRSRTGRLAADVAALADKQKDIWGKYDDPFFYEQIAAADQKGLVNRLDRYVLHALEECHEAAAEPQGTSEHLFEMTDVALYALTIAGILRVCARGMGVDMLLGTVWLPGRAQSLEGVVPPEQALKKAEEALVKIRTLWPERKWHKPSPPLVPGMALDRVRKAGALASEAFQHMAEYASSAYGPDEFERALAGKRGEVASLRPVEGLTM